MMVATGGVEREFRDMNWHNEASVRCRDDSKIDKLLKPDYYDT